MADLVDGGERTTYATGGMREMLPDKGRCDLLPLDVIGYYMNDDIMRNIDCYIRTGSLACLWIAIDSFTDQTGKTIPEMMREVAIHYGDGAKKYADRNWELGIPLHSYIDSGVRHYLKWLDKLTDEPHDRAFVWNMLGAIWTHRHRPEQIDLPFKEK